MLECLLQVHKIHVDRSPCFHTHFNILKRIKIWSCILWPGWKLCFSAWILIRLTDRLFFPLAWCRPSHWGCTWEHCLQSHCLKMGPNIPVCQSRGTAPRFQVTLQRHVNQNSPTTSRALKTMATSPQGPYHQQAVYWPPRLCFFYRRHFSWIKEARLYPHLRSVAPHAMYHVNRVPFSSPKSPDCLPKLLWDRSKSFSFPITKSSYTQVLFSDCLSCVPLGLQEPASCLQNLTS